ncbi:hypothetical protein [Anatilimnocola floriformis]|uniref:hypothetical protein n=1 Tax=Anatilimnocola floriformis TaxID=2948575 RepID=UPI0020C292EC|nr:hypothetical protein [Anatilimnocola floriformis]
MLSCWKWRRDLALGLACVVGLLAAPGVTFGWQQAATEAKEAEPAVEPLLRLEQPTVSRTASFDELSQQFAEVRKTRKHFATGQIELFEVYERAMNTAFQGVYPINDRIALLKKWSDEKPEDPTPLILLARFLVMLGWDARGQGFAGQVTEGGGRKFIERLQEAAVHAKAAEKLKPADPELYRILIEIGKGLGTAKRDDVMGWVRTASKIDPKYYPVYQTAAEFFLTRWHGEPDDIAKLAEELQESLAGDDGYVAYARIAERVNCYDHELLYEGKLDGEKVEKGALILAKQFPRAPQLVDFQAIVAWKALRHSDVKRLAKQLKWKGPEMRHWGDEHRYKAFVAYADAPPVADKPESFFWPSSYYVNRFALADKDRRLVTIPFAVAGTTRFWRAEPPHDRDSGIAPLPTAPTDIQASAAGDRLLMEMDHNMRFGALIFDWAKVGEPVLIQRFDSLPYSALSPNGKICATQHGTILSGKVTIRLWDTATVKQLAVIEPDAQHPKLYFSPDSKLLMVNENLKVWIYDVETGKEVHKLSGAWRATPYNGTKPVGFVGEATLLATSSSFKTRKQVIVEWNAPKDEWTERVESSPRSQLRIEAFNEKVLVVGGFRTEDPPEDGKTIRESYRLDIFQRNNGKLLGSIDGHTTRITSARLTADGKTLFTAEDYGPIQRWKMPIPAEE